MHKSVSGLCCASYASAAWQGYTSLSAADTGLGSSSYNLPNWVSALILKLPAHAAHDRGMADLEHSHLLRRRPPMLLAHSEQQLPMAPGAQQRRLARHCSSVHQPEADRTAVGSSAPSRPKAAVAGPNASVCVTQLACERLVRHMLQKCC